jgi:cyclophilin family peptidyl-prolyl cis-trans isomerase
MKKYLTLFACAALLNAFPLSAQKVEEAAKSFPAPGEIVAKAGPQEWVAIAASDLLVMELTADAKGKPRRVVIQLMPVPFSQGWIGNIRKLAAAKFWDGTSVNRVQDNYVVQWGDATEKKVLPDGLAVMPESGYVVDDLLKSNKHVISAIGAGYTKREQIVRKRMRESVPKGTTIDIGGIPRAYRNIDPYSQAQGHYLGWPIALHHSDLAPVHCYGMVGVGRNLSPDTGTGAELYTVIGHAPRHLDRNIALVGRVIEGIELLSSLPRGTGGLGFYESEAERTPIMSVRIGDAAKDLPAFEYLSTESESFAAYADARANRRDPFFIKPAGGADICNIPVPVRRKAI